MCVCCLCVCVCVCVCVRTVRCHLKFAYHDTIVRVSRYTLGIDTSHDMAYKIWPFHTFSI